ncbi:MAG TPA: exodeoxyribonuclease III [Gammaproteobacteria bacterium]|nr:exodeoxyribonuclease III [Gammaproteobacteria bacterium]
MRIITINSNGIRAAGRKGFYDWMLRQHADVVCIQETKAQEFQLTDKLYHPPSMHSFFHDAEKKGYSGVALYCRHQPDKVVYGLGWPDIDAEGRYIQADYGNLSIISLYMPSGSSKEERQDFKYDMMERMKPLLLDMRVSGREYLICGDLNIAHKQIDLKNWRSNQNNSGFLPEERAWMDWLIDEAGYVDTFRLLEPGEGQYTWWSNRGRAWDNNTGWRIDYQIATPAIATKAVAASIYKKKRFSDHSPLIIDYDYDLLSSG